MSTSKAQASWTGTLKAGRGTMKPENAEQMAFSMGTRFEGVKGTNPEEVIGAALAGCFSMALSLGLEQAGATPEDIQTSARVKLEKVGDGFEITSIALSTEVTAEGIDAERFAEVAEQTKRACPVSKALGGVGSITLTASLASD